MNVRKVGSTVAIGCYLTLPFALVLWLILGSVMLAVNDTVDGKLKYMGEAEHSCCCTWMTINKVLQCVKHGCTCTKTSIDFVSLNALSATNGTFTNETLTVKCRGVVDKNSLPDAFDLIDGSYETVTTDCWVNKPLPIPTLAIIGAATTAFVFVISLAISHVYFAPKPNEFDINHSSI